eukprot:COSAG01_NODE_1748_length_9329_cov_99.035861_8_plen_115_part_00
MQTLGALGWDGGGQPFVCETTMKKTRDKARTDGRKYAYTRTVRPQKGEPFPVLVGNAGPHKETVKAFIRLRGLSDWRSLRNPRISRNFRNLQNRNSAAAGIALRFGPKILLKEM